MSNVRCHPKSRFLGLQCMVPYLKVQNQKIKKQLKRKLLTFLVVKQIALTFLVSKKCFLNVKHVKCQMSNVNNCQKCQKYKMSNAINVKNVEMTNAKQM